MTEENSDKRLERLVRRAGVPRGFRPESDADIEKLLDTVGGEPYSKEKLARMLAKAKGDRPDALASSPPVGAPSAALTESERELAELYKAQGKPLPPDLEAKLKEMEKRAAEPPPEDEPRHGG